jgi:nitroimidazol reductase NimA-like FMN-containing flavoprotein (pyridoxamine 5'-phosphate oxidase superfamily)
VIVKGRTHIVEEPAGKLLGLSLLMAKYQPEGGYGDFPDDKLNLTAVIRIDIEHMTGKEDLGTEGLKEAALKALQENMSLPVTLERE